MRRLLLILFCLLTWQAPFASAAKKLVAKPANPQPVWELSFSSGKPTAVFFDVASGALFVSLRDQESGRIAKVSLEGKIQNEKVAASQGVPGPLRSFDGRIYWISGDQVQSWGRTGVVSEGHFPKELGDAVDLAITRNRVIYLGTTSGAVVRLQDGVFSRELGGAPVTGLFLLEDTLHILRGTRLHFLTLGAESEAERASMALCEVNCYGLERTNGGNWLTVSKGGVLEVNGAGRSTLLLSTSQKLGRPAYVYRRDPKDDFYVLPFQEEGKIRAYRLKTGNAP